MHVCLAKATKEKFSIGDPKIHFISHQEMHLYNYADFAEGHSGGLNPLDASAIGAQIPSSVLFSNGGAVVQLRGDII